ncbi:amidase [Phytoactinopolyspora alkaliphila]|uniref:Amidase n=1 Tax=Phytoactinopolyspora alkaliphila TaxID=1783498 RepID=A0A6N9YNF0_9ACTN|nr:amidase [Phytoactinopolyspora alkaliphila]NED96504.1 amidase [Phytoactinopolyspora alkaliphila]
MTHVGDLGLVEASRSLAVGELSAVDLVEGCLDRIAERDPSYGAWLNVYADRALEQARGSDQRRTAGMALSLLDGVPVGLKDVIGAAGYPLTGDSAVLAGNIATVDSGAWSALRRAGVILLGHLHCGEFACGAGQRNPWGPDFSAGGSSSGSGVALAIRTVPATLGTDTRGSIRNPCAQNGVTGVKPTYGLVDAAGIIPLSTSYDVVGPMARSAADCSALMSVLATRPVQPAQDDLTWPDGPRPGKRPLSGTRIGVPQFAAGVLAPGVAAVLERFTGELRDLGAQIVPLQRPDNPLEENGGRAGGYKTIIGAEAAALHNGLADRWGLFREEFRKIFPPLLDTDGTAAQYVDAQRKRTILATRWRTIFDELELDAIAEPCMTGEILRVGYSARDPNLPPRLFGMWSDTNFPVVSLPGGLSHVDSGPVGLQLIGVPFTEPLLLQIAIDYQARTAHHLAEPPGLAILPEPLTPAKATDPVDDAWVTTPFTAPVHPFKVLYAT